MDERTCKAHDGGSHCWHEIGQKAFKGKWESSSAVKCCHCGRVGVQRAHAAEWVEYGPAPSEP